VDCVNLAVSNWLVKYTVATAIKKIVNKAIRTRQDRLATRGASVSEFSVTEDMH
jgi:hypothetical protein